MKILTLPPRLDTGKILSKILKSTAVNKIATDAEELYNEMNPIVPWSEVETNKLVSFEKNKLIFLLKGLFEWLTANRVSRQGLDDPSGNIGIRTPATIKIAKKASVVDLSFFFAAIATAERYSASLLLPANGKVSESLLILTTSPDTTASIESGTAHILNFLPLFDQTAALNDPRGSDLYENASNHDLTENDQCYLIPLIPSKSEEESQRLLISFLKSAVFSPLSREGYPKGGGFFISEEGYALTSYHLLFEKYNPEIGKYSQPIFNRKNQFTIRYFGKDYPYSAEWFPKFSNQDEDFAVIRVGENFSDAPPFNILPLSADYTPGADVCLFGFDEPDAAPLGQFHRAAISNIEPETAVPLKKGALQQAVKLLYGTFDYGLSGSPVINMDTGCVFAIQSKMRDPFFRQARAPNAAKKKKKNKIGYCTPIRSVLSAWGGYSSFWPRFEFRLI